ncbi:MAG: hypothetical protein M0Q91_10060 [Methanoregula sp.]|jgi:H+/Cl- antiporter ClcA|nr:hypothetical protein [Methanoregula sp.]
MIEQTEPIITAVGAAVLYSLLWYCRKVIDPTKPTPQYNVWELGSTVTVGIVIGIISVLSGLELTQVGLETQLIAYGFIIAAVEQVGRAIYRNFIQKVEGGE